MDPLLFPDLFAGQSPRMWGIYPQRQEGLYMQRAKVSAGRLSPVQLRLLADVAHKFTAEYPLHLTMRQDVELHGIHLDDIRQIQKKINSAGLTCIGACGDSVRNITVCPGAGICPESRDVSVAADAVKQALDSIPFIQNLPRKFKISFSGCEKACALPFVNDLGFVYHSDGAYSLFGAGSLGPPPQTGILLSSRLLGSEIVTAATAAVRLFHRLGDRKKRHTARLRHVRERLGDEEFLKLFHEEFRSAKSANGHDSFSLPPKNGYLQVTRLQLPFGDITPEQALQLADAVERADGEIRIDLQHGVWLVTKKAIELSEDLLALVLACGNVCQSSPVQNSSLSQRGREIVTSECESHDPFPLSKRGREGDLTSTRYNAQLCKLEPAAHPLVTCCPGATWCSRGLTDCRSAAEAIAAKLKGKIPQDLSVRISGCPNNCPMPSVADIGLIGRVRNIDDVRRECYQLVAGGGSGKTTDLAIPLASAIPAEQVPQIIEWLIDEFLQTPGLNTSFGQFIRSNHDPLKQSIAALISSPAFQEHRTR